MAETKKRTGGRKPKSDAPAVEITDAVSPETGAAPEKEPKRDEEIEALKLLVRQLQDQLKEQKPRVVQVMADTEKVVMRFQAEVADDNVATFGPEGMYGQVTGKTGTITVPKSEWSRFYNESVRNMIYRRWLIVLSGMDEQERELYGCNYKPGEVLDEMAFHKLLDLGRDLVAVFPALCETHKEMVASRFLTAWMDGDSRAMDRELIVGLNELSKSEKHKKGMFTPIIEGLNAKDAE